MECLDTFIKCNADINAMALLYLWPKEFYDFTVIIYRLSENKRDEENNINDYWHFDIFSAITGNYTEDDFTSSNTSESVINIISNKKVVILNLNNNHFQYVFTAAAANNGSEIINLLICTII